MDETPKEYTAEELEFLDAMSLLLENERFKMLVEAVLEEREKFTRNLAGDLVLNGGAHAQPVNQRYIDYQRGFWNGVVYAVTKFPKRKAKDWEKFVAEQTKESDAA